MFAIVLLQSFGLLAQQPPLTQQDSIPWDKNVQLQWSDFTGRADTSSQWVAVCPASVYVRGFMDKGLPNFLVTNSFMKKEAWTKDPTSANILRHEQLHFDIAEVYARKIRQSIDSLRRRNVKTVSNYSLEITKLIKKRHEIDSLYDEQTSHGTYGDEQSDWNQKILKELEALNDYAVKPQLEKETPP